MLVEEYNSNRILFNFLIPQSLKESFDVICKYNISNKSQVLNKLIKEYVMDNGDIVKEEVEENNLKVKNYKGWGKIQSCLFPSFYILNLTNIKFIPLYEGLN